MAQTYKNIEIILVDDGSPDNSGKICDKYAKQDKRIRVIHKSNSGPGEARNTGIKAASGDFVALMDCDDWLETECCEILFDLIIKNRADISSCAARSHGMTFRTFNFEENKRDNPQTTVYTNIEALEYVRFVPWGKIYPKKMFNEIKFPAGRLHDDVFTVYKLIYNSSRVACTSKQLYNRRVRPGSITRSGIGMEHLDVIDALKERAEFYREHGLEKLAVKTEKSLVGTIARLKVKSAADPGTDGEAIAERLDVEFKKAVQRFRKNPGATFKQKMEVFLYERFPEQAVFGVDLRNKIFIKKVKN